MNNPIISIWCLVYNHGPYLRDCLEGFVRQMTEYLHHSGQVSISEFVHEMVAIRDRGSYENDNLYDGDGPL